MTRSTNIEEELKVIEFVKKAAKNFAENPHHASYGEIGGDNYIALRWGLGYDCVLVLKQDEYWEPRNYTQAVERPDVLDKMAENEGKSRLEMARKLGKTAATASPCSHNVGFEYAQVQLRTGGDYWLQRTCRRCNKHWIYKTVTELEGRWEEQQDDGDAQADG